MKKTIIGLLFLITCSFGNEYGNYDMKKIAVKNNNSYVIDFKFIKQVTDDLFSHAANYPVKFDNNDDKARAKNNTIALMKLYDMIAKDSNDIRLLTEAANINSIGHNLDIVGAYKNAIYYYEKALSLDSKNPTINYLYGNFLGGSGSPDEAIKYLNIALDGGKKHANWGIGLCYVTKKDNEKALKHFIQYQKDFPDDQIVGKIIQALSVK